MLRRALVAIPFAVLALCAPAQAGKITYGSDLSATATTADHYPRDFVAWPTRTSPASRNGYVAPATGEVTSVAVKGTVLKPTNDAAYNGRYPDFVFHVLVLHPHDDGTNEAMLATEDLPFPFGGDPQQITTFELQHRNARICVQKGDIVALATSGGFGNQYPQFGGFPDDFYADGYPVQMFHRGGSGTSYRRYRLPAEGNGQGAWYLDGGDRIRGQEVDGQELLMRTTVSTGADARWFCRTDAEKKANLPNPGQPAAPPKPAPTTSKATIPAPAASPKARGSKVSLAVACPGPLRCTGSLALRLYSTGARTFSLTPGQTAAVKVTLNKAARRKLVKRGAGLTVKAMMTHPDGSHTTRRFVIRRA